MLNSEGSGGLHNASVCVRGSNETCAFDQPGVTNGITEKGRRAEFLMARWQRITEHFEAINLGSKGRSSLHEVRDRLAIGSDLNQTLQLRRGGGSVNKNTHNRDDRSVDRLCVVLVIDMGNNKWITFVIQAVGHVLESVARTNPACKRSMAKCGLNVTVIQANREKALGKMGRPVSGRAGKGRKGLEGGLQRLGSKEHGRLSRSRHGAAGAEVHT